MFVCVCMCVRVCVWLCVCGGGGIAETQHEAASKNPEVVFDIESLQNRIHALLVSFREISVFLEGCPDPSSSPQKRNLRRRFNDISSDGESGHEATAKSSRGD